MIKEVMVNREKAQEIIQEGFDTNKPFVALRKLANLLKVEIK